MQDKGQFDKRQVSLLRRGRAGHGLVELAFNGCLRQVIYMFVRLFSASGRPLETPADGALPARGLTVAATAGQSLSHAIWLSGLVRPLPLCGGLGRCGRCRVRFVRHAPPCLPAEEAVFTPQQLAEGWRLACRRQVPDAAASAAGGDAVLELELPSESIIPLFGHPQKGGPTDMFLPGARILAGPDASAPGLPRAELPALVLAVDLGTTSLCWRALDAQGTPLADGRALNPQAGAGADIMSRLAVASAPEGRELLAQLVRHELQRIVDFLLQTGLGRVERMCLAANTAMTDIFLNRDVQGLCAAPYRLDHSGDETAAVPGLPPVYIPPLPAPFVGGDVSAGLAALLEADIPRPFVLADLGTNGELALVTEAGDLWLTSVPLGPALEGIGPECGQLAGPGVVTGFALTPMGLAARFYEAPTAADAAQTSAHGLAHVAAHMPVHESVHTAGGMACPCPACQQAESAVGQGRPYEQADAARGISATGYLSLLALLLRAGVLRDDGQFVAVPAMPLARKLAAGLELPEHGSHGQNPVGSQNLSLTGARLRLPHGLWLAAADVEELLKVKAAFALALNALLQAAGLPMTKLATLCLAGTLGEYVNFDDLETVGFVPSVLSHRIRAVGNTSLDGAALLALNGDKAAALSRMCRHAVVISLVDQPNFHTEYLRHMRFGV